MAKEKKEKTAAKAQNDKNEAQEKLEALEKEVAELKEKLANCDEPTLKSLSASMKAQDNRPTVGLITVPVTYFYADPGSLFSPALADWYKEHITAPYKAVRFPDSNHMLVSDYPEKFAEEVGKVLQG